MWKQDWHEKWWYLKYANKISKGTLVLDLIFKYKGTNWRVLEKIHHFPKAGDTLGDFDRQRKSPANCTFDWCGHTWRFSTPIAAICHSYFVPSLQAPLLSAILKSQVIKVAQPDWLTHLTIRRNGHTRWMPANLIADIWHVRYRRFYTPIAAIGENRNRCTGNTRRGARKFSKLK